MSSNIARLGFEVATEQLKKGVDALRRLKPAANEAATATEKVATASDRAATATQRMASGAATATAATSRSATGANAAGGAWQRFVNRLNSVRPAAQAATGGLNKLGQAANDNIGRLQATPGNIAAQFQDVGVTAAAGMSPMLIALQQGTQLSAAFAGGGLASLGGAVRQLISPISILTIGIVALVAAGIQMVDWAALAKSALNGIADAADAAAPYVIYLGAVMLIAFGPQILKAIYSVVTAIAVGFVNAIVTATGAMIAFAIANPFTAIVLGIGLVIGIAILMGDTLTKILGFDIVKAAKDGTDFLIGSFVGAYNTLMKTWRMLPAAIGDAAIGAANSALAAIDRMINRSTKAIDGVIAKYNAIFGGNLGMIGDLSVGRIDNPYAGTASKVGGIATAEMAKGRSGGYVDAGVELGKGFINQAGEWIRSLADSMGADADKADGKGDGASGRAAKGKKSKIGKKEYGFDDLLGEADERIRLLKQENQLIGLQGYELARLTAEQSLMNKALSEGLVLDAAQIQQLKTKADLIATQSEQNRKDQFITDINKDTKEQDFDYEQQRKEIFLTGEALAASQIEYELLRKARLANIELTPTEVAAMGEIARAQAGVEAAIRRTRENVEFARQTTKEFFQDFRDNLLEGQSLWSSFADAADAALTKIINRLSDKLFDAAVDQLIGLATKLIPGAFADGGAFNSSGVTGFANGGAFTNSVVDRPTAFAFGKGGSNLGIMGEAGPEAIMPLQRGSDGSLGVQMYGGAGGQSGGSNISVDARSYTTLSGALSSKDIVDLQKEQAKQTEQRIKKSVVPWLEQYKRDGALN
jgi:hypothetical protein